MQNIALLKFRFSLRSLPFFRESHLVATIRIFPAPALNKPLVVYDSHIYCPHRTTEVAMVNHQRYNIGDREPQRFHE